MAWLKGTLKYHPTNGDLPDSETNEIVEGLVQLNRRGFVTTFSQPDVSIPESGSGQQRAAVEGFPNQAERVHTPLPVRPQPYCR